MNLREEIKKGYVAITFNKKSDGTKRTIIGTTRQEVLKENNAVPKGNTERKPDPGNIIRVYCPLEAGGWRSVDENTIINIEKVSDDEMKSLIEKREEEMKEKNKKKEIFQAFLEKNDKVLAKFEKANGELREMICTRKDVEIKKEAKGLSVRVFDLEKDAERTINTERLKEYEVYE